MIVPKSAAIQRMQGLHGFGLPRDAIVPDYDPPIYRDPVVTAAATTTTSGTPQTMTTLPTVQGVQVSSMPGTLPTVTGVQVSTMPGTVAGVVVDPQAPVAVTMRGGVPAGTPWTLPTDKPWNLVFDPDFYYAQYPDLQALVGREYGSNPKWLLYWHFINSGLQEGRCAHPNWCVGTYVNNYPDLQKAYNDPNWWNKSAKAALDHYFSNGIKEGRSGAPLPPVIQLPTPTPIAVNPVNIAVPTGLDASLECLKKGLYYDGGKCVSYQPEATWQVPVSTGNGTQVDIADSGGAIVAPKIPMIPILLMGAGALVLFLRKS